MQYNPGTIVDDRYRILDLIGLGGMGAVYKAVDIELEREVALKVLHDDFPDEETRRRFQREGKIASHLEHPNIVQFFRFGYFQGCPYIAMEHLAGDSLRGLLTREGKIDVQRMLEIALQVCRGMQYAHQQNVVHRDLKPNNIMLLQNPEPDFVKVVDFGLARVIELNATQGLTQTGSILGTAQYMSPEQCKGQQASFAADIYSLGCIIYEAITGVLPLEADTPVGLIHKHVCQTPRALSVVASGVHFPSGLQDVLFKSMAKEPVDRYASMALFEADLKSVQTGRAPIKTASVTGSSSWRRSAMRSLLPLALVGAAALFVIAVAQKWHLDQEGKLQNLHQINNLAGKTDKSLPLGLTSRSCESLLADGERFWRRNSGVNRGEAYYKAALAASKSSSVSVETRLRCYWTYAAALKYSGRVRESVELMEQAIVLLEKSPNVPASVKFQVYKHAAFSCRRDNYDVERANRYLTIAENIVEKIDSPTVKHDFTAELLENQAASLFQDKQYNRAFEVATKAVACSTREKDLNLRRVKRCRYGLFAGRREFNLLCSRLESLPLECGSGVDYELLAEDLHDAGKSVQSQQMADKAIKTFNAFDLSSSDCHAKALLLLGEIASEQSKLKVAAQYCDEAARLIEENAISAKEIIDRRDRLRRSLNGDGK